MRQEAREKGFVIDGPTRTGSTTLAALLNRHPDIQCLVEPFHPLRYGGQFHNMAVAEQTVEPALNLIWYRWSGIKHVWESSGWPFVENPELNNGIVLGAQRVIFLRRRNLLRRCISSLISKQLRFWVGTREEFYVRLEDVQLTKMSPNVIVEEIKRDEAAVNRRLSLLRDHVPEVMHLFYEDLYAESVTITQQRAAINDVLAFLGFTSVPEDVFVTQWAHTLNPDNYRWSSPDVYRQIPGIERIESAVGCDRTGWLFR